MRADLEMRRGSPDAALGIYDRAFQPLWPEEMMASYFKLLEQEGKLRDFAGRARAALASNHADLDATARIFQYFRSQNNIPAARRALLEYRIAKESGHQPWTADELQTLAQLFERLPDVNEAARLYYALYSVPPARGPQTERALYGLANLLLTGPDQPIQFGSGDLSFYKDIATVDSSPGFLNGILSLVLNWTGPRWEYERQNEKSAAYFHRAAASQLVALLEQKFPRSEYRAPLRAALVTAYQAYGDDASVIRAAVNIWRSFRAEPRGSQSPCRSPTPWRARTAPLRNLLYTIACSVNWRPRLPAFQSAMTAALAPANMFRCSTSISLAWQHETSARCTACVSHRDRSQPQRPGLYERFAAFLEQNGMAGEVEAIYTKAIAKFADRSWYDKLARWYLRCRQTSALEKMSRDVIAIFFGQRT